MKIKNRMILSVASSFVLSGMVIVIIFFIIRNMNDEATLVRTYSEIEYKIEALNLLITRFPSLEDASRTRQIKDIRESLINLLGSLDAFDTDEESLLQQIRIDYHDLGYTLDEIISIPLRPLDNMSAERYNILVSQLLMMNQFIADNAHVMAEISRNRINAAQQKAGILILALIVALVLINALISFFSGRSILRVQVALRESENRFRMAINAANIGIFVRDLQRGEDYWSPEFLAIYGCGPDDQLPLKDGIPAAVHPEDLQKILDARKKFYHPPVSEFNSEHRIIRPDGQIRWVMVRGRNELDVKGQPLRTHGLVMDITERKIAEEELTRTLVKAEEGERTLDALMEHVPEGITIADAPDVKIRRVSRYGVELTGKTKDALTGIPVDQQAGKWDIYEADGVTLASNENMPLTRATKYGEVVKDKEYVLRSPNSDNRIPILCNAAPIFDQHGKVTGGIIAWRDITERKKAEEALRQWNETLEQKVAQRTKLAEKRTKQLQSLSVELIEAEERERSRIAQLLHEGLQQDIAAARFQLQAFQQNLPPEPALVNIEKILLESITKSRRITHELSPPILEHSSINSALQWLVRHMREQFGLQVDLEINSEQEIINQPIKIFIFRALQELLFNVHKHSGVNSAKVRLTHQDDRMAVMVSDQGKGFDMNILDSTTVKDCFGLLSLRERASYIGGNFLIQSTPDQGSRFILSVPFSLPSVRRPPTLATDEPVNASIIQDFPASGTLRVILVDDHKVMRQGLIKLLSGQPDIEVVGEAANGLEAIELTRRFKPDVIVMDISMPEMDGVEATRIIKGELPEVRVIGLSMFEDESVLRAMLEAKAETFLTKTSSSAELIKAIHGIRSMGKNSGEKNNSESINLDHENP